MYSNGTWVVNNPVPPSESRWGSFNELELNNKKKLTEIPIKRTTQYIVSIRQDKYEKSYLKKGVNLPKSYEALARAVGKYMIDKK